MSHRALRQLLPTLAFLLLVAACGEAPKDQKGAAGTANAAPAPTAKVGKNSPPPKLLLAPEDLRRVSSSAVASGPVITGSIQPERRADLRAEVSAVVTQVLKENGEPVHRGDLLLRLDDTSIRDSLASAEEALRASTQAFEQTERQLQRQKALQAQGMTSMSVLEDAEVRRNNAQSDLVAARARVASARQQLSRTEVRAPFDGVVSERKASVGDTAQVGKELVKVIDPRSMRFEGLVSADRMHELKQGQEVSFRVNGYPNVEFGGKVKRIDASANATTRQVEVLVSINQGESLRVAGLYAEGRIETGRQQMLLVPEGSVVRAGDATHVWLVKDDKLVKTSLALGPRDARSGNFPVKSGLAEGDRILRSPGGQLVDGQAVEFAAPAAEKTSATPPAAPPAKAEPKAQGGK